jgi:hypothetical protein
MAKRKRTNTDLQNIARKTKDRATRNPKKPKINLLHMGDFQKNEDFV